MTGARRPFNPNRIVNPFRLLPIPQHVIARARAAGVDTKSKPAIEHWRRTGEVRPASYFAERSS